MQRLGWRGALCLLALVAGCRPHKPRVPAPHIVATLPHARTAFTQGLAFWHGHLFEGTGLYGLSSLRELDPVTGEELRHVDLDLKYFGEGITVLDGRIYMLTWREHRCLVYDATTLHKIEELPFDAEGWGIANDGRSLITSDGSPTVSFRDPKTLAVTRTITVTNDGQPVNEINELEVIDGELWANVWRTDAILRIALDSGRVLGVIDTTKILPQAGRSTDPDDVLNGIAFDDRSGRVMLTGKRWPALYYVDGLRAQSARR